MAVRHLREARIVLPEFGNDGSPLCGAGGPVTRLEGMLVKLFGGYTRTEGVGAYMNGGGHTITESVIVYDVACYPTQKGLLRTLAETFAHEAKQEAVYLRYPDGIVEFVTEAGQPSTSPLPTANSNRKEFVA